MAAEEVSPALSPNAGVRRALAALMEALGPQRPEVVEAAMANLNFQQTPRSLGSQNLSRATFGGSSGLGGGHVTPTSSVFPSALGVGSVGVSSVGAVGPVGGGSAQGSGFAPPTPQQQQQVQPPPQQLSPNRSLQAMANRAAAAAAVAAAGGLGVGGSAVTSPALASSLYAQRGFPDRRTVPGLGSSALTAMGTFGLGPSRSFGSQGMMGAAAAAAAALGGFPSSFAGVGVGLGPGVGGGGGGDSASPPLLDLSEFPSLTNRGQGDSLPQPSPMPTKPYVGMVKQPTTESSEFTMSSEDFPALPGTQSPEGSLSSRGSSAVAAAVAAAVGDKSGGSSSVVGAGSGVGGAGATPSSSVGGSGSGGGVVGGGGSGSITGGDSDVEGILPGGILTRGSGDEKTQAAKRGIQTSPDGKVTDIPGSMVKDQFGMVGLLTFIRAAETDPNLVSLALGSDLTALGLNLNSTENLYPNFGGPWAETPCRPQDIDFHVPPEYLINAAIRDKLAPVKLNRYKDDLLFSMFYTNVGDVLQLAAAAELYNRDWRYHKEEKVWITRPPGMVPLEKTSTYERGTYYFFDAQSWRKVAKEFHLDYDKLEERPHLPPTLHHNPAQAQAV